MNKKKGFWRNFSFKKWVSVSLIALVVFFLIDVLDAILVEKEELKNLLTLKEIFKHLFTPIVFGFLFTLWVENPNYSSATKPDGK